MIPPAELERRDPHLRITLARACSYLILKEKAKRFAADGEIQRLIAEIRGGDQAHTGAGAGAGYTRERAQALGEYEFDAEALAQRGRGYEELDQLVMELLLGVR